MEMPNSSKLKANLRMGLNRISQSPSSSQFLKKFNIGAETDKFSDKLVPKRAVPKVPENSAGNGTHVVEFKNCNHPSLSLCNGKPITTLTSRLYIAFFLAVEFKSEEKMDMKRSTNTALKNNTVNVFCVQLKYSKSKKQ